jgi:hypothetical protein
VEAIAMRLLVVAIAMLCACMQSHAPGVTALAAEDCYTCHKTDYEAAPDHVGKSTTCSNCHRTTAWIPALDGNHSDTFVISSGPHSNVRCLECHIVDSGLPSKAGANTNCIQCHPNDSEQMQSHVGATSPMGAAYTYQGDVPNFCLSCHPTGLAGHPRDRFPLTGNHSVPCASCHLRSTGPDTAGMNTSCIESGCHHTLSWSDNKHEGGRYATVRGDASNKHFCLASGCHPDGRN